MGAIQNNGYVSGALLMNKKIREMREYVEFEKFVCRMLVDNDTTREMKENTEMHNDSMHKFIYNSEQIDKFTMRGKMEALGKSSYTPDINTNAKDTTKIERYNDFHNDNTIGDVTNGGS